MRLVIEKEHIQQVVVVVGSLELPMTREQVVEMLFGDGYKLVPIGSRASPIGKEVRKKQRVTPPGQCARCGKKALKGKKTCGKHYAVIVRAQAAAAKARVANKREAANGMAH